MEKEINIIRAKVPEVTDKFAVQIAAAVRHLRHNLSLNKHPSIAETLDWTRSLIAMHADYLDTNLINQTMGLLFKNRDDLMTFRKDLGAEGLSTAVKQVAGSINAGTCHCNGDSGYEGR